MNTTLVKIDTQMLVDAIHIRKSIRNFEKTPLKQEDIEKIQDYLNNQDLMTGPFGKEFKLVLLQKTGMKDNPKIGTYGMIRGAQAFLVGISSGQYEPKDLFEIAHVFHGLVLYLTALGIGTCFIGGSFSHKNAREAVSLADDEIVPVISPIGYAKGRRHLMEAMATSLKLKPHKRKSMDEVIFFDNFDQAIGNNAQVYHEALSLARFAPNAKNRQPCRVVVSKDLSKVHFYVKFSLKDEVGTNDEYRMYACPPEYLDIGCFYRQFELVLKNSGIEGTLNKEDPGLETPDGDYEYIITWTIQEP